MLFQCRANVCDAGPTLKQQWINVSGVLSVPGYHETLTQYWLKTGPALKQHWVRVCWFSSHSESSDSEIRNIKQRGVLSAKSQPSE